jgi:hypothetical protein
MTKLSPEIKIHSQGTVTEIHGLTKINKFRKLSSDAISLLTIYNSYNIIMTS